MSTDAHQELLSFHQFVAQQLHAGQSSLSPEEALEIWRLQNRSPEEYAEDVQAIREALADMDAGIRGFRGRSLTPSFASGTIWICAARMAA